MLIQLPYTKDWINPHNVTGIYIYPRSLGGKTVPEVVIRTDGVDRPLSDITEPITFEEAEQMRDRLAEKINAVLYQEGKKL